MDATVEPAGACMASATIEANFVGRPSIVHIPDGRTFRGTFVCVDSGKNIILADTQETSVTSEGRPSTRNVGMVMIPGNYVVKVEVKQDEQPTEATRAPSTSTQAGWADDDPLYS